MNIQPKLNSINVCVWVIRFCRVLWHINHCRLFNAKSSFYIYIKYMWFGLVDFYGIRTIVGYLMPNPFYTYIIIIIMSCRQHGYPWPSLATSSYYSSPLAGPQGYILCPHIAAVCMFELVVLLLLGHMWGSIGVGFYGISTIVGYLMPNSLYTYILNIYDLVWLGFMAYQPLLVI